MDEVSAAASPRDPRRNPLPKAREDFARAANDNIPKREGVGSKQVRETSVDPRLQPPPALDRAGARIAHVNAMRVDDRHSRSVQPKPSREERLRSSKEAFLKSAKDRGEKHGDQQRRGIARR